MKKRKLRQQKKSNKKKGQYCTTTILTFFLIDKLIFLKFLSGHLSMKCDYAIIQSNASIFKGKMIYLIND